MYQRALQISEQQRGPEHLDVAYPLHGLAELYRKQGRYAEAEPVFLRELQITEQQLGPEHPEVAYALTGLADLYSEQNQYAEAEPLYQRALSIREQRLGPKHLLIASPLHGLATLYLKQGKYAEGEPLFQRALHIREQQLGPDHPDVATVLSGLANLYREQGKFEQAERLFQRALAIDTEVYGAQPVLTRMVQERYDSFLRTRGYKGEAVQQEELDQEGDDNPDRAVLVQQELITLQAGFDGQTQPFLHAPFLSPSLPPVLPCWHPRRLAARFCPTCGQPVEPDENDQASG